MIFQGIIVKLTRYAAKGAPGEALESAQFLDGLGMEGDYHATGGERQISLLSLEERQWMDAQTEPGLCFGRYRENILLDGIPSAVLAPGVKITAGEAVLEISDTGKHCFEACHLYRKGQSCVLSGRNLFAKVIRSGLVRTGDGVEEFSSTNGANERE